jgi:hypothetical protein
MDAKDGYGATEFNVRCPRDGVLRGFATTYEWAKRYADRRDEDCGCCRPQHGPHVVVSRRVTGWTPVDKTKVVTWDTTQ